LSERQLIAPRPAPRKPRRTWSWANPATRALVWQLLAVAAIVGLLGWLAHNTQANMLARGIRSGWDFLTQPAGFDIGEQPIPYDASDSYGWAFVVGLLNTLRVAVAGIVICTVLGALVGVGRYSPNLPVRALCRGYVELFRNIPLLVQLLVWYLLLVEYLPDPTEAWRWGESVYLSKAGLRLPFPAQGPDGWHWSVPVPDGMALEGGAALSSEFLAVLAGLSFYTAAFVAEVVRAGIAAVPRGQVEAAQSIGLNRWQILRKVTGPQALRLMVPPLTNQYLNLTKNSSLAVAVGYPELVSVANTSLNQTGRALECIAILMAVYLCLSLATALVMGLFNRRAALRER
jgi:general L-amino acid transport system permease protein